MLMCLAGKDIRTFKLNWNWSCETLARCSLESVLKYFAPLKSLFSFNQWHQLSIFYPCLIRWSLRWRDKSGENFFFWMTLWDLKRKPSLSRCSSSFSFLTRIERLFPTKLPISHALKNMSLSSITSTTLVRSNRWTLFRVLKSVHPFDLIRVLKSFAVYQKLFWAFYAFLLSQTH